MPPLPRADPGRATPPGATCCASIATALRPARARAARAATSRASLACRRRALEALADTLLHTELYGDDAALLPFVGAALQVCLDRAWRSATRRQPSPQLDVPGVCPCCGFLPVASVVRPSAAPSTTCATCTARCATPNGTWCASNAPPATPTRRRLPRAGRRRLSNPAPCAPKPATRCKSYLKIVYQEKGPGVDPVADDLATLALDILVDEAGYARPAPICC